MAFLHTAVVPRTSTSLAIEAKMEMLITVPAHNTNTTHYIMHTAVVPRTSTSLAIEAKMEMLITVPAAVEEPLASLVVDPAVDPALHVSSICC
jgi:hypothetical protein